MVFAAQTLQVGQMGGSTVGVRNGVVDVAMHRRLIAIRLQGSRCYWRYTQAWIGTSVLAGPPVSTTLNSGPITLKVWI
jgi:hypothetical protein